MTIGYEALVKHLNVVGPEPFGLLSREALPTAGILNNEFGSLLKCLFSPEHGWFGFAAAGEKTQGEPHPFWGVPIHSLYGDVRRPTPEMLEGLGRVVIDLQDIGVRCYTYLATIKLMLEACAEAGVAVTVLDRPVPLGGIIDGPMRDMAFASFVAPLNVPFCHGMTPAECAKFIVREEKLDLDLTVIKLRDWSHAERTPWRDFMPPSPAIRSWDCAALYPATVFSEAFNAIDCDRPPLRREPRRVLPRHGGRHHPRGTAAPPPRRNGRERPHRMARQARGLHQPARRLRVQEPQRPLPVVD